MKTVPLQPVPSQQIQVTLDGQLCAFSVYVKNQCMLFDAQVNGSAIAYGIQCKNLVHLVPTAYLGFTGILTFYDTQGMDDPIYTGLGSRWVLLYLDSADLGAYGVVA
ncbi:MAG: phage baseplate plug family protein [Sulfobacillus sp.]